MSDILIDDMKVSQYLKKFHVINAWKLLCIAYYESEKPKISSLSVYTNSHCNSLQYRKKFELLRKKV